MKNAIMINLSDHVYEKLQLRAKKQGITIEEEARQIISHEVSVCLSGVFQKYFGEKNGVDLMLEHHQTDDPIF